MMAATKKRLHQHLQDERMNRMQDTKSGKSSNSENPTSNKVQQQINQY